MKKKSPPGKPPASSSQRHPRLKSKSAPASGKTGVDFSVKLAGQLVYDWDPSSDAIAWGGNIQRVMGYRPSELTGGVKQWLALIHPQDRSDAVRSLNAARRDFSPIEAKYRLRRKDGRYIRIVDRGYFLPATGRKPRRMIGVIQDITEHERIGRVMEESERRYHSLVSRVPVGLFRTSASGEILDFNLTGARMFGYETAEQVLRKKARSFYLHPRDRFLTHRAADRNGVFDFEAKMKKRDGAVIWVRCLGQIIRDSAGRILFFEGSLEDITERRRIHTALNESMELFSTLIQRSPVPTVVYRDDGRTETINERFIQCFGYTLKDIPTLDAWLKKAYPDKQYRRDVLALWNKAVHQAARRHVDIAAHQYRVTRKDGKVRLVEIFGTKIGHRNLVMMTDVTERRQAEVKLAESEEQYRTLIELSPDPIFLHTEGVIRYANSAGLALLGAKRPGQVVGRSVYDFVDPKLHTDLKKRYWEGVKNLKLIPPTEEKYVRLDGSVVDVEAMAKPFVLQGKICAQVIVRDITERNRMLETLRANEERFRTIVENSPSGIFIVDHKYKFRYINNELSQILGAPARDVIGLDFKTFIDKESLPLIIEHYTRRKRGDTAPARYELWGRRRNGEKRLIELSTSVVRDPQGNLQIIGQLLDITERRQSEENTRRQLAFDEMLAGISADFASYSGAELEAHIQPSLAQIGKFFGVDSAFIILAAPDRRSWSISYQWGTMGGRRTLAEYENIPMGTFAWSEKMVMDGQVIKIDALAELPPAAEVERKWYRQDGFNMLLEVPFHGKGGSIVGCIGLRSSSRPNPWSPDDVRRLSIIGEMLANVFDRKNAEEENHRRTTELEVLTRISTAMRMAHNRSEIVRVILQQLPEALKMDGAAILRKDPATNALTVELGSRAWEQWTGVQLPPNGSISGDVIISDQPYLNNDAGSDPPAFERDLFGPLTCVACIPLSTDQQTIGLIWTGRKTPILEQDVRLLTAIGDMAANAIQRQSLNENLRVQLQNLQQTRSRLLQSEKLAAIGELVSGVAHELNNPLTSIVLYSQLVQQDALSPLAKSNLAKVTAEALRAGKIVRDLLDFSRQRPTLREIIQVNDIVRNSVEFMAYEMRSHDITWTLALAPDLPLIMADPHQLTQVFINLIQNAWQAQSTARGQGNLNIWTERVQSASPDGSATGNAAIRIGFQDNGPGIPDEIMDRIFDPFFTTKPEGTGTGLGLSICHGIVNEHGGHIWAENAAGKGATFIVELQTVLSGETAAAQPAAKEAAVLPMKGARILVLDDESNIRNVLTQSLQRMGYIVDAASNGIDGLALVSKASYAFILCDIRMPGINGLSFFGKVLEMDKQTARKIIFITGDTANKATRGFIENNKVPCLRKPFELIDLRKVLTQAESE
jgi:PAS domain S-box-containing protein